jgi:hypothetical protein
MYSRRARATCPLFVEQVKAVRTFRALHNTQRQNGGLVKDITGKTLALTLFATLALAACGGGDSGSTTASNAGNTGGNTGGNTPPASSCAETGVDAKYA